MMIKRCLIIQIILFFIQIGILIVGIIQAEDLKTYIREKAYVDIEWTLEQEEIEKDQTIVENFITTSDKLLHSYWHSEDKDLRLTVGSPAINQLKKENYLYIKESKVNEHLILTLYFSPLHPDEPGNEDLIPTYRVVKYKKPDVIQEIEERAKNKDTSTKELSDVDVSESFTLDISKYGELTPKYPFEESQIVFEDSEFIVYTESLIKDSMMNFDFYRLYIGDDAVEGDYGWEKGLFYEQFSGEDVEE